MKALPDLGRTLVLAGLLLVLVGLGIVLLGRTGIPFGRLPGDINLSGRRGLLHFPIVTCLVLSAAASFVLWLISRLRS